MFHRYIMLLTYPACFLKEEKGYSVIFPDLNYTATCGDTLDEAFSMAVDCLAGYLYSCKMDGEPVPDASELSDSLLVDVQRELELDVQEGFVNMVAVDVEEYARQHFNKSVKKTLTIPAWLNKAAMEQNINFSQVLQEALKKKLRFGR